MYPLTLVMTSDRNIAFAAWRCIFFRNAFSFGDHTIFVRPGGHASEWIGRGSLHA
jgi:hypothetical protein